MTLDDGLAPHQRRTERGNGTAAETVNHWTRQAFDLLDLPFDQYQRYRDVKEVVDLFRGAGEALSLLDVGGAEGERLPALDFFPGDRVLVADPQSFPSRRSVRASGVALPFADRTFDVAFSCDTLEHVAPGDRTRFVGELLRVARRLVIVVAPFHSPVTELAEQMVQQLHLSELGVANTALLEHAENGLPDASETAELLARLAVGFRVFPSGNIHNWLVMNAITFTLAPLAGDLCQAANRIYNAGFYAQDHSAPSYRLCFVAGCSDDIARRLDTLQRLPWGSSVAADLESSAYPPGTFRTLHVWREGLSVLKQLLRDKDVHIANIQGNLETLRRGLADRDAAARETAALRQQAEERAADLGTRLASLEEVLARQRAAADRMAARARELEHLVRSRQEALDHIQSGLGWRLLERVWAWNTRAFPEGSRRRAAYEVGKRAARRLLTDRTPSAIRMNCDTPQPGERVAGTVPVRGWCIAPAGIEQVELFVDGASLGRAIYGQLRPDIARDFPDHPDAEHSGFLLMWQSRNLGEGPHELDVLITARDGRQRRASVPIVVDQGVAINRYREWANANEPTPTDLARMAKEARTFPYRPLISIVVPAYRTPTGLLREAIQSVLDQTYDHWQLCIADDASGDPALTALLRQFASADPRIVFTALPANAGIAAATNAALGLAQGEFVGLLDSDDTLAPDALHRVVALLQDHRDADLVYSDEDKLDTSGERFDPFFKPEWSPDLLLSMNYICHFTVVRRSLVEQLGRLRSEFDGSQDYDLVLRVAERTRNIHHLPHVLYHWRACPTSTALSPEVRPRAHTAAQRAIEDHLVRTGVPARVDAGCGTGRWRVRYEVRDAPRVAIILPTGGRLELLRPCLEGIFAETAYPHYEIVLIDNSKSGAVRRYVDSLPAAKITYLDQRNRPFNYSALNNLAVRETTAPLLLFLNDDTTVTDPDWLTALVEHGQRPTVGAVGAKLLYPFGLIQHAGVVMGLWDNTGHAFRNLPDGAEAYFGFPQVIRNCSAVTAACMMTRRKLFLRLGGFDEVNLAVAFQDVDYCLRACEAGLYVVYTPYCTLIHHESVTKDEKIGNPREVRYMENRWASAIASDPFYSPHLTRRGEDYGLRLG